MLRHHESLNEPLLVLEAAEGSDSPEDVVIDGLPARQNVRLHHLHHGLLQLEFSLATGAGPGVSIHLFKLQRKNNFV